MVQAQVLDVLRQEWIVPPELQAKDQLEQALSDIHVTPIQVLGVEMLWEELLSYNAEHSEAELYRQVWEKLYSALPELNRPLAVKALLPWWQEMSLAKSVTSDTQSPERPQSESEALLILERMNVRELGIKLIKVWALMYFHLKSAIRNSYIPDTFAHFSFSAFLKNPRRRIDRSEILRLHESEKYLRTDYEACLHDLEWAAKDIKVEEVMKVLILMMKKKKGQVRPMTEVTDHTW